MSSTKIYAFPETSSHALVYIRFDTFVKGLYYNRREYDPCFYFKGKEGPNSYYLSLFVDDMLLVGYD